jgi:hypothetical protein
MGKTLILRGKKGEINAAGRGSYLNQLISDLLGWGVFGLNSDSQTFYKSRI